MTSSDSAQYVLIEGPRWGDAGFYGKWLLAAAKVQRLFEAIAAEPVFAKRIERLSVAYIFDFGIMATQLFRRLTDNRSTMAIDVETEEGEIVAILAELRFFVLTGERYQMAIPKRITAKTVKRALIKYALTEDAEFVLHPESMVRTMRVAEVECWERRLRTMPEAQRLADRGVLLLN